MVASLGHGLIERRDRWRSIAAVAVVHICLAYALLYGLSVQVQRTTAAITKLIAVQLDPPVPVVSIAPKLRPAAPSDAAPVAVHDRPGGSTGPSIVKTPNPVAPIVACANGVARRQQRFRDAGRQRQRRWHWRRGRG